MKKIQIMAIALVAVFAFSVVASASAAEWLVKGAVVPAAGVTVDAKVSGALLLEDMGAGVDVLCEGSGVGLVLPAGADEQTSATCTNPVVDAGTCGSPKVTAVNFNWTTQLSGTSPTWVDSLKGAGGGAGWKVECTVLGIKVTDECVTQNGKTLVTNGTEVVNAEFPEVVATTEQANCTVGGKEVGLVVGTVTFEALEAGVLVPLQAA